MRPHLFPVSALAFTLFGIHLAVAGEQAAAMTDRQKIENAMNAAPAAVPSNATINDWPAKEGGELRVLREGSSEWVCLPDDPMCLDLAWQQLIDACMAKAKPQINQAGIAYMLSSDAEFSNTDPYATGPTAHNHWHKIGPTRSSSKAYQATHTAGGHRDVQGHAVRARDDASSVARNESTGLRRRLN